MAQRPNQLRKAQQHLRQVDPVIGRLIDARPDYNPRAWLDELPRLDLFGSLIFQVTGQQLSVAATRHTVDRLTQMFAGEMPSPAQLLAASPADLRAAGLSWRKVSTLRDLAERLTDGRLDASELSKLPDEDFVAELTKVPGIGPWTAQGALLVALRREDIVLPGDLALRKAIRTVYNLDHLPTQDEVVEIAEKWRPYRSFATSYLFSSAFEPEDPSGSS
jgi:DNA-3-methyladenine glycosylase II